MNPLIFKTTNELIQWRKSQARTIGFVPTMGALHEGHKELLRRCRDENEISVLSIFVNPTQFNDPDDFSNYPKTWQEDLEIAKKNKVDIIFNPEYSQMYPDHFKFKVIENDFSKALCGKDRPGHFDGVLSIVMKLFNLVRPQKAYFGEKDFQQLTLIKKMTEAFFMNLEIIPVPTVREASGLAKSSRNSRLSKEELMVAPEIYRAINTGKTANEVYQELSRLGLKVDYVEDIENRRFVAAHVGKVRLIDNIKL